ncbi:hypothetical protein ACFWY6_09065 [Streptomyces sp. NPDC059037]|uniref:hypothetical protein n=1 Tax=Streptomyces sp. NPDC059037 TaxID=3346710 RepID=UPI0036B99E3B
MARGRVRRLDGGTWLDLGRPGLGRRSGEGGTAGGFGTHQGAHDREGICGHDWLLLREKED